MFIPMHVRKNRDMHWALAVVVNASHIQNGIDYVNTYHRKESTFDKKKPAPCILYLDSGDDAFSATVANSRCKVIREWLDYKSTTSSDLGSTNDSENMFQYKHKNRFAMRIFL